MYDNTALYESIKLLGVVPLEQLDECLKEAENLHKDLHSVLLSKDLLNDADIGKLKADLYLLPFVKISDISLSKTISSLIPQAYAKEHRCLAIKQENNIITIACSNPKNATMQSQLKTRFDGKYDLVYATDRDISNAMKIYADDPKTTFDNLLQTNVKVAKKEPSEPPIIQIVDTILRFAYERGASDVHIEPTEKESLVRFRIDGVMHDIVLLPQEIHPRIVTRIKVMSNLRTDENQRAQDGKLSYLIDEEKVDVRVSLIPIIDGENIVLRLLSEKSRQLSLLDLGLSENDAKKLDEARQKPHGMILSTGPTGSGKTTTLYSLLKLLNSRNVTIMTIEDPVEYEIEGISQIQVNKDTNLTFAEGLRSIVRQDPNIILIGEIRDNETAEIAINSSMTGHLVLSTLHTNDAATTIPRLIDMNIEPFLIASTINIIVAQRLVRKICTQCRYSEEIETSDLTKILSSELVDKHFPDKKTRIYKGKGCPVCQNLGYSGRIGIFETMTISDSIQKAIIDKSDANTITEIAIKEGMSTMLEDGLLKIKAGLTTIEEVMRVTKE
ncbi:MAG: GspE/PulE family protein [bacterium]